MLRDYRRLARRVSRRVAPAILLCWCAVVVPSLLSAWHWPIDEFEMLRSFGARVGEYMLPGVDLVADPGSELRPVEDGEIVYRSGEYDGLRGLHSPLGSVVALEHERGFRTLYTYLSPPLVAELPRELTRADTLGTPGETGFGEPGALLLQVYDQERRGRVNPELLLPHYRVEQAPVIERVALLVDGDTIAPEEASDLPAGSYTVLVETHDTAHTAAGAPRLSPYRIVLESLNGDLRRQVALEFERVRDHRQWINAQPAVELVRGESLYAVGEVEPADEAREYRVTVVDHLGGLASRDFTLPPAQVPDEAENRAGPDQVGGQQ